MTVLTKEANEAKKVTSATETKANGKGENLKNETKSIILETTAEKRIKNGEHFQKICDKHTFLKGKSDDLNSYMIGRDGLKEKISIKNTDGMVFEISNTNIIDEVLKLCQEKLFKLVDESEKEVLNFVI